MLADEAPPRPSPLAIVGLVTAAAIALFAVLFFVRTYDPAVLFAGIVAAALVSLATGALARRTRGVTVRCRSCRALNEETSRFCGQCGKPL